MRLRVRWYANCKRPILLPIGRSPCTVPRHAYWPVSLFTMARTAESCTPDWVWKFGPV
jgi:hypothetical protein